MSYQRDLIRKLNDSNQWPDFERAGYLLELDTLAQEAYFSNSHYGYLSAVLIYHQLSEELIKLVIQNAEFFVQLSVYPMRIDFPKNDRLMFGQMIKELEKAVDFDQKKEILNKVRELNKIRIQIVHKLTRKTSLKGLKREATRVKNLFDELVELCQEVNDFFRLAFKDFRKDIDWEEYFE